MNTLSRYGAGARQLSEAAAYPQWQLARVVSQFKDGYRLVTEDGERLAALSGKLRYAANEPEALPAVGDYVLADGAMAGDAVIHRILSRKSLFVRTEPGNPHGRQVIAANVDVAFLCMAAGANYSLRRMERYLAVAWDSGATPVVVLTKADLCEDLPARLSELALAAPGADVLSVSAEDAESCQRLLTYLQPGVTGAFLGSSGVGKSTLINRLAGGPLFETGAVRSDGKGRHTTTSRELALLPAGGIVLDTPGMRELGAEHVDLASAFADIEALARECRFADCAHGAEPGCAVRRAVEAGTLDLKRLESFLKLKREAKYDGLAGKALEREKGEQMFAAVGGIKNVRRYIRQSDKRRGGE